MGEVPGLDRLSRVTRNLILLARTGSHHAAEDPLLLVVQSARRLPRHLRTPVARLIALGSAGHPGLRPALAQFVSDRPDDAATLLGRATPPRTAVGRRLAGELAVHLGHPESIPGGLTATPAVTQARWAWRRGDISVAIQLAGSSTAGHRYGARLVSERAMMQPGFRLPSNEGHAGWEPARRGAGPRALHVLTNSLPHTSSGYTIRSHAVLRALLAEGIEVEAVTRIGYPVTVGRPLARAVDVVDGVRYRRVLADGAARTPVERLQQMVAQTLTIAEDFRPTVLHTTTNYSNALVTEAVARTLGLPWVYEVRGQLERTWLASLPVGDRAAGAASERYALLRAKETEMMLAADQVVTLGETLREDLVLRGVPPERVTVVPNAVDAALLDVRLDPAQARGRVNLPEEGFWVGTVSSLVDYEGLDALLDAVALLRAEGLDVRLALVGDGVSRSALETRAARLGLGQAAVLPGRVGSQETALWHRALDVFVVPRRDLEVCRVVTPLKPMEAMAAGRPVIASDLPALVEVVRRPDTGVMVPPGDVNALAAAIRSLASDALARARYGERGRAFAATRTWAAHGQRYREVYESLAGAP